MRSRHQTVGNDTIGVEPAADASSRDLWRWVRGLQVNREQERAPARAAHDGCVPTPPATARFMARRLLAGRRSKAALRVLDAGCGAATLLASVVEQAQVRGLVVEAHGVEQDAATARWAAGLAPLLQRAAGDALGAWRIDSSDFLLGPQRGPYDLIIANPPYVSLRSLPAPQRAAVQERFACGQGDLAALFVQHMLTQLSDGGRLVVIVPNKLLATTYAAPLRQTLLQDMRLREVHDVSRSPVFPGIGAYPVILVADRARPAATFQVHDAAGALRHRLPTRHVAALPGSLLPLDLPAPLVTLVDELRRHGTLGDHTELQCGIAVSGFGRAVGHGSERILQSGDVQAWQLRPAQAFDLRAAGLDERRVQRQRVEKIVVPGMFQELCAARCAPSTLLGRVYYMPVVGRGKAARERAALLLALLNSRLYRVLYRGLFDAVSQAGGWLRLNGPYLRAMPWPDTAPSAELLSAVEACEAKPTQARLRQLDSLVEALFGLEAENVHHLTALDARQSGEGGSKAQAGGPEPSRQAAP